MVSKLMGLPIQRNKGDRRDERLRSFLGDPPGRDHQGPLHVRDHPPEDVGVTAHTFALTARSAARRSSTTSPGWGTT